jgi:small-conductance mechanosensitive channel
LFHKPDQLLMRNSLMQQIKENFEAEGIQFAYPTRTLYTEPRPAVPARSAGRSGRRRKA